MLALPSVVALLESGEDADRHMHAGAGIADRRHNKCRRVVREAGDTHRTPHRLGDRLVALEVAIGAVSAKALDRGVDQPRVDLREDLPTEPQPVEGAGPEIFEQHVRLGDDLLEQLLASAGLQIEGQAALVSVEQQEEEAVCVRPVAHVAAGDIATLGFLELDHVGAEKTQDLGASRSRLVVRHVDDANVRQRLIHVVCLRRKPRDTRLYVNWRSHGTRDQLQAALERTLTARHRAREIVRSSEIVAGAIA